jgi:hypothetical protein
MQGLDKNPFALQHVSILQCLQLIGLTHEPDVKECSELEESLSKKRVSKKISPE